MIEYIVEVSVEQQKVEEWVKWMSNEHIPDVMSTGLFLNYTFTKSVTDHLDSKFIITYRSISLKTFKEYQMFYAKEMQSKHSELFGAVTSARRRIQIVTSIE